MISYEGSKPKSVVEQGAKKTCFLHFKCKYLAIYMVKVCEISSTHFYTSLAKDPTIGYAKNHLKYVFALCYRNGNFE